jgi:tRNA (cmo5U34)-methyltransferase
MTEYRFTPEGYVEQMLGEIHDYVELQEETARATEDLRAVRILELGTGTGETARRVLARHPQAHLTGIDSSPEMLARAREELPEADLRVARLEDPLPTGPFDLVVSALAVHHLDSAGKTDLFHRVRDVLAPQGVFVMADVVVPKRLEDAVIPLTPGFDLPDSANDQLEWLAQAGFVAELVWESRDIAVLRGRPSRRAAGFIPAARSDAGR